jgi:hypothetical protein
MRNRLLSAVETGDLEILREAYDWNELPPALGKEPVSDPVAFFKTQSADGQGMELLAILGNLLHADHTTLPIGPDAENPEVFVWPALAERPLDGLSPADVVALYRLVPAPVARDMLTSKKWTWYRIAIGSDGTWHAFQKFR